MRILSGHSSIRRNSSSIINRKSLGVSEPSPTEADRIGCPEFRRNLSLDRPLHPQDVLATMYRHLGVDTKVNYPDFTGRPNPVLPYGDPIEELF